MRSLTNLRRAQRRLLLSHQASGGHRVKTTADVVPGLTPGQALDLPVRMVPSFDLDTGKPLFLADYDPADSAPVQ